MGPVTPLLAVLRQMKKRRQDLKFVWAGTASGPEREVIGRDGIPFHPIPVAKLPRYFTLEMMRWPMDYLRAANAARVLIKDIQPSLVVSAGGFTAVPVIKAAYAKGIPCAIHQLDAEPGLSNASVARLSRSVTTSFSYDQPPFRVPSDRVPTPCRFADDVVLDKDAAAKLLGLDGERPIVFITGGGTGALALNEAVSTILDELLKTTQVIHLAGKEKQGAARSRKGYVVAEFFDEGEMLNAYAAADLVVSRAGLGSLSELACLKKAAIIVPIPDSHQEENAERMPYPIVAQGEGFETRLIETVRTLLADQGRRRDVGDRAHQMLPTDDGSALAERWLKLL